MVSEPHARSSSIDRKAFLAALIGTAFPALTIADSTGKFSSKVIQRSAEKHFLHCTQLHLHLLPALQLRVAFLNHSIV
jgi:hypothetical protein